MRAAAEGQLKGAGGPSESVAKEMLAKTGHKKRSMLAKGKH